MVSRYQLNEPGNLKQLAAEALEDCSNSNSSIPEVIEKIYEDGCYICGVIAVKHPEGDGTYFYSGTEDS